MKLRKKWKRAKIEIGNQREIIKGLERRNKYLYGLCERIAKEKEREIAGLRQTKNLLRMLLEGAVVEAGGVEVHTEGLKDRIEQYRISYDVDEAGHRIRILAEKKQG